VVLYFYETTKAPRAGCETNSNMSSSIVRNESFRHRLREGLNRLRRKSRDPSKDANVDSTPRNLANPSTLAAK
jgi:hypothetical protein